MMIAEHKMRSRERLFINITPGSWQCYFSYGFSVSVSVTLVIFFQLQLQLLFFNFYFS